VAVISIDHTRQIAGVIEARRLDDELRHRQHDETQRTVRQTGRISPALRPMHIFNASPSALLTVTSQAGAAIPVAFAGDFP
jgi:hypothetical protein